MSDQLQEGANAPIERVQNPKAVLEAQLNKFSAEQAGKFEELPPVQTTAATPVQEQPVVPPPVKTPEPTKTDSLQQFRDKEGNVDPSKIEKANENLVKATQDKEARLAELLKQNKELQRKFTKTSQEVSEVAKQTEPNIPVTPEGITPEFRKQLLEDLDKDLPGTLVRLTQSAVAPLKNQLEERGRQERDMSLANELDTLVEQGHSWIQSEGLERFNQAFAERPWLLQSKTPYKDALKFIPDPSGQQSTPAPGGMRTPILGANHAVPPPSSQAPVSTEQELSSLRTQLESAINRKDRRAQQEILTKMDEVQKRAYASTWY